MPLTVTNPFDQSTVAEIPYESGDALEGKLARAQATFRVWRELELAQRAAVVAEGLARFRQNRDAVARDVTLQMGKPWREAQNEVNTFLDRAEYMLAIAPEALAPELLPPKPGFHRRIEHAPLGIVLDIAAWNYPLLITVNVIVPALLAGNVVLLKHSARTPLTGDDLAEAFGFGTPRGLVTNLVLDHEMTARLINDPRIAHVSFTGSVAGGRAVYGEVAKRLIDAGLELGGKDPAYVAADADLDFTVPNVVEGACYNAGQSCCAVERVYVHARVYDEFLARARRELEGYRPGDPLEESTTLGPLASRSAPAFLQEQVDEALARGAELLAGGGRLAGSPGNFYLPTLLAGVPNDATVMQEESFGPLLPVCRVASDEEAIELMNGTRFGLTASIWTRDRERAEHFARDLEAGTIFQNRCDFLDPALPWTGWRDSGKGSTLSRYGFHQLTRRKAIHFRDPPGA